MEQGEQEHPDMTFKNPSTGDQTFRRIDLQHDNELYSKIKTLDINQRAVLDKGLQFTMQFQRARKHENPPLLIVHGGAGLGKSYIIDVVTQMLEKIFRNSGDDPNHSYILKLALTGNASIIKGQTIHSAFQLPFNNDLISTGDKIRDKIRIQLQNLQLIISDKISLIKSDMLYQLHFRQFTIWRCCMFCIWRYPSNKILVL